MSMISDFDEEKTYLFCPKCLGQKIVGNIIAKYCSNCGWDGFRGDLLELTAKEYQNKLRLFKIKKLNDDK